MHRIICNNNNINRSEKLVIITISIKSYYYKSFGILIAQVHPKVGDALQIHKETQVKHNIINYRRCTCTDNTSVYMYCYVQLKHIKVKPFQTLFIQLKKKIENIIRVDFTVHKEQRYH